MGVLGRGNKARPSRVPTEMPTQLAISRRRRLAGSGALVATAGTLAAVALQEPRWVEWGLLACAGVVGAAGVAIARRSMVAQVLARATAWTVLAPSLLVAVVSTVLGHPEWTAMTLTVGSGGALLLARPMLHTAEARAQFAPTSFRRWLLAGATASASVGLITGLFALDALRWHPTTSIPLFALALSLLGSAAGVARMRAWGILLGGLTSVVLLLTAVVMHSPPALALALAAFPGFMLLLPVLLAKRDRARAEAERRYRVATAVPLDEAPARVRVASDAFDGLDTLDSLDEKLESAAGRATAVPPPAARAQA